MTPTTLRHTGTPLPGPYTEDGGAHSSPADRRFQGLEPTSTSGAPFCFTPGDESLEADARRAAATESPVLIMGEPGTGRSALARFIHTHSRRASGSLVELDCRTTDRDVLERTFGELLRGTGGTVLLSGLERGAPALGAALKRYIDMTDEGRLRSAIGAPAGMRLICEADQDLRSHVDRSLWQLLVAWPPLLLAPLRIQRRRKWNLFSLFAERAATERGLESPLFANFLLYAHVVSYGWPGNARQLLDFTRHLVGVGALLERRLLLDAELSFFDENEGFATDDVAEAKRLSAGALHVYRNRRQRDFSRALAWLQTSTSGPSWRELSKAQPGTDGRWSYPDIRWTDPHFAGAEMCASVGQALDGALVQLGQWQDRVPARELLFDPTRLPWTSESTVSRVVAGVSGSQLAELVAYALVTGEISDREALLTSVYEAIRRIAPDLSPDTLTRLGVPKSRPPKRETTRRKRA